MNDVPTSPDALDHRIDAALRRRFVPPPGLETLAARALPRRARPLPWLALVASIAATLAVWLWVHRGADERRAPAPQLAAGATHVPELSFCRLVGPLREGQPEPGLVHSPDLARIYHDMDACQRDAPDAACGTGDNLAERLRAIYGQPFVLRPESAGRLHGPFGSDEWPTATIVTGTSDGRTVVLVADRDATMACCVSPLQLQESSGLRLFPAQVGEVALTEITPLAEPRFLAYFE